ncbi:MAG: acetylxylan esterase [Candidatus Hydrogenedentes bacterium]|nr:acetylxylan esterase [Candidatus Hydrogenedentota bacterium]
MSLHIKFVLFCQAYSLVLMSGSPTPDRVPPKTPWDWTVLSSAPKTFPAEGFPADGVRSLFFEGPPYHGKPTRVFAWYGAPPDKPGASFPAMVLVHGGGGTAFAEWVRLWTGRGYAAIAMDTCGCVPRGTYGDWEHHADGGPPGWGGFGQADEALEDQWPYHAVADVVLAHSLLRSFPEVDPDRIGITGISWGGYLTCIAAGVDFRFKFAVPVYGCGFLGDNSAWLSNFHDLGAEKSSKWLAHWDPSVYLPQAAMPILWVTGTNDFAYPMDSLQKTYLLPAGPRTLCIRVRMPHGHGGPGENPEEIRVFADSLTGPGPALPEIIGQGRNGRNVWLEYAARTRIVKAELNYTCSRDKWQDRLWETIPAELDADHHKAAATLPESATVYYLNLTDDRTVVVSTQHEEMNSPS